MAGEEIRYFVDADLMSVGISLARLRKDVTHPGHPQAFGIVHDTDDIDWLAIAGRERWVVLTKDRHIRTRPAEIQAVHAAGARMVVITGNKQMNSFDRARLLLHHWEQIEELQAVPGPWIWSLTQGGLRQLCPPWPGHVGA